MICPLHLHIFDLATGCATSGQADLTSYPVEVNAEGFVVVHPPGP